MYALKCFFLAYFFIFDHVFGLKKSGCNEYHNVQCAPKLILDEALS